MHKLYELCQTKNCLRPKQAFSSEKDYLGPQLFLQMRSCCCTTLNLTRKISERYLDERLRTSADAHRIIRHNDRKVVAEHCRRYDELSTFKVTAVASRLEKSEVDSNDYITFRVAALSKWLTKYFITSNLFQILRTTFKRYYLSLQFKTLVPPKVSLRW